MSEWEFDPHGKMISGFLGSRGYPCATLKSSADLIAVAAVAFQLGDRSKSTLAEVARELSALPRKERSRRAGQRMPQLVAQAQARRRVAESAAERIDDADVAARRRASETLKFGQLIVMLAAEIGCDAGDLRLGLLKIAGVERFDPVSAAADQLRPPWEN